MTINAWLDENTKLLYGRTIRVIDSATRKGVGDMLMFYMDKEVVGFKVTHRFVFIFI